MAYSTPVQLIDGVLGLTSTESLTFPNAPVANNSMLIAFGGDSNVGLIHGGGPSPVVTEGFGFSFGNLGSSPSAGPDLGINMQALNPCGTTAALTIDCSVVQQLGPAAVAYELAYGKNFNYAVAKGTGSNSEAIAKIASAPSTQQMFFAVAAMVNDVALPSSVSGSNLGWSIDYQATLIKYPTTGDTSIPLGTKYVTFASALASFADITADFGLCTGNWTAMLQIIQLVVPATTTINAVRIEDFKYYNDTKGDHFVIVYTRGNYDGTAFLPTADALGFVDYLLVNTDTFAVAWGNLVSALNTAEGTTISMVNTGSEATGLAHFVNATGTFNNDPWFPDGLAGRFTVGTVLYH